MKEKITTIVALTSFTTNSVKQECYEAGIVKVINKPLLFKQLHKVMWQYYFRVPKDDYLKIYKNQFNVSYQESD